MASEMVPARAVNDAWRECDRRASAAQPGASNRAVPVVLARRFHVLSGGATAIALPFTKRVRASANVRRRAAAAQMRAIQVTTSTIAESIFTALHVFRIRRRDMVMRRGRLRLPVPYAVAGVSATRVCHVAP